MKKVNGDRGAKSTCWCNCLHDNLYTNKCDILQPVQQSYEFPILILTPKLIYDITCWFWCNSTELFKSM